MGTNIFYSVALTYLLKNFNVVNIFSTASARASIFRMNIQVIRSFCW